jgi:hypothetical protein
VNKAIWKAGLLASGLGLFLVLASLNVDGEPSVLVIAPAGTNSPTTARKLVSFSEHGRKEVAELSGQVVFGTDENAAAFLQTPGSGPAPNRGSRPLVIEPKKSAIIADLNLNGFAPSFYKATTVSKMAVRSQDSTVYFSEFEKGQFGVVEANWKTGSAHRLPLPVADTARRWEITSLFTIPYGIGVTRGPFLTLFDTTAQESGAALTLPIGPGGRPAPKSGSIPVPGFGRRQLSEGTLSRLTDKDFLMPFPTPVEFPSSEMNRNGKIVARTIDGRPSLISGEKSAQANGQGPFISEIVVFDLESHQEVLRKPLGTSVLTAFQPDASGFRIYFIDPQTGEILCLNQKSREISSFAKTGIDNFSDVGAALVDAN